jgi:hypothetical protein
VQNSANFIKDLSFEAAVRKHGSLCYFKVSSYYREKEAMLRIAQVWQRKTREENQQKKRAKRNLII